MQSSGIHINQLDRRVGSYDPLAYRRVYAALRESGGKCVVATHLGFSLYGFPDKKEPSRGYRAYCATKLSYTPSYPDYQRFLRETITHLEQAATPVFLLEDPELPTPKQKERANFTDFGSVTVRIPCGERANPKPRMHYASGSLYSTQWASLRAVFRDLGVTDIEFVGEILIDYLTIGGLRSEKVPRIPLDILHFPLPSFGRDNRVRFCVGRTIFHLLRFDFWKMRGRINYPYTFPGIVDFLAGSRLDEEAYAVLRQA